MQSILTSIKKLIGIGEADESFDTDIIMAINTSLAALTQMGVGPTEGYTIQNKTETWDKFLGEAQNLEAVKSYIYLKTRLLFDPPTSSALLESIYNVLSELEFRISVQADSLPA